MRVPCYGFSENANHFLLIADPILFYFIATVCLAKKKKKKRQIFLKWTHNIIKMKKLEYNTMYIL